MNIELNCNNCNKTFTAEFKHRNKKFCGRTCFFEYSKKNGLLGRNIDESIREDRLCLFCNEVFVIKKKSITKICSQTCRVKWNNIKENKDIRINKSKSILLKNYGVDSIFKDNSFKIGYKKLFLDKYGVDNPMKKEVFITKLKSTLRTKQINNILPKLFLNKLELLDEYKTNKNKNTSISYNFKCLACENKFTSTLMGSGKIPICRKCYPLTNNSKLEQIIKDFLNENNIIHSNNNRKLLDGIEVDLLIDDLKLGLEINGNYFHSEYHGQKDKNYHLNKSILADKKNIKLIHIFEDEINNKKDIVLSRLSNLLNITKNKVFARKCEIKEVTKSTSIKFLENNHIQGNSIDKFRFGLFFNDELISLITFGLKRKALGFTSKNNEYELIRFCNKLNYNVIGSFSKLLKFFIRTKLPTKIITYSDIRWSGLNYLNTVYYKNGFSYIGTTKPNYWYLKKTDFNYRLHRFNFRKDILIKNGGDPTLTEFEIMRLNGYDKIWDCGNLKFEFNIMNTGASFDNV